MIARTRVETIGRCLPPESGKICTLFYTFVGITADVGTFFDFVSFNVAGGLSTDNDAIGFDTVIVAAPEPSSLAVLGFAAAAMVGSLRLTKKRARTAAPPPA